MDSGTDEPATERVEEGGPTVPRVAIAAVPRIPIDAAADFAASVFAALGVAGADARAAADLLLLADLRGVESHGLARLPTYAARFRLGLIDPAARLTTVREGPATLALDAGNGFGLLLAPEAMARCVAKAEATGLCLATVRRGNHFGIAGAYALMAARRGLGGLAMTNASPLVVPTFGAEPRLGTNPIAVAVPTGPDGQTPPLVLDMATSAVAWGKVEVARRAGTPLPAGWAVDETGRGTTDPWAARWLTPLGGEAATGGHKGYGLAAVVDLFCGPLAGAAWGVRIGGSRVTDRPADLGHAFLAWRIDAFRDPAEFYTDLAAMIADLRTTRPAPGHEATGVLVPGDPEAAAEATSRRLGVPVRREVLAELRAVAAEVGVPFALGADTEP